MDLHKPISVSKRFNKNHSYSYVKIKPSIK